ncbi:MAG: M56 family metallopeptidase, partial [Snowella sp.]|nr:M56 family metallopeptidase [Snowella sp.]
MILILAVGIACLLRALVPVLSPEAEFSWQKSLFFFVFPPILLLMTALAVVSMGYQGMMFGLKASWLSYSLAIAFLLWSLGLGLYRLGQATRSIQQIQHYPQGFTQNQPTRILDIPFPYSAQIGLWNPELVISQGLLDSLDEEHLQAVLAHENAHYYYRDTFWFFCLGWLREISFWLPQTEQLWQDLLFMREVRADKKAAQQVDPLLLAESLMLVAKNMQKISVLPNFEAICAAFNHQDNRLITRINYLIEPSHTLKIENNLFSWILFTLAFL